MTDSPVSLITGASSGIGAAVARRLLDGGHRLALTGRRPDRLEEFAKELGKPADVLTFPGDASDYPAVSSTVGSTIKEFGRLDTVIANAGFVSPGNLASGDPAEWREMVLTNVLGPALLIRAALPALKASRGRIVLIGSVAGLSHTPGNLYGATKFAITGLAENTRLMVTGDGVGVTLIAPGRVETNFWEPVGGVPHGEILTAEQVAESIVWAINQPAGVDINTVTVRPFDSSV
jgi:NADP-dependent 3-hydroxy acid dehydrogenase YdfG